MKRIEYQLKRCIDNSVAYTPVLVGYPTLLDITELYEIRQDKERE